MLRVEYKVRALAGTVLTGEYISQRSPSLVIQTDCLALFPLFYCFNSIRLDSTYRLLSPAALFLSGLSGPQLRQTYSLIMIKMIKHIVKLSKQLFYLK